MARIRREGKKARGWQPEAGGCFSEPYAHTPGDQIALPVVESAGIAEIVAAELEVAGFVGALHVPPLIEGVSNAATQNVAVVKFRARQSDRGQLRGFIPRRKFRRPVHLKKSPLI